MKRLKTLVEEDWPHGRFTSDRLGVRTLGRDDLDHFGPVEQAWSLARREQRHEGLRLSLATIGGALGAVGTGLHAA